MQNINALLWLWIIHNSSSTHLSALNTKGSSLDWRTKDGWTADRSTFYGWQQRKKKWGERKLNPTRSGANEYSLLCMCMWTECVLAPLMSGMMRAHTNQFIAVYCRIGPWKLVRIPTDQPHFTAPPAVQHYRLRLLRWSQIHIILSWVTHNTNLSC